MKRVGMDASGRVVVSDVEPPRAGPHELLLEMRACGLCGTDIAKIQHPGAPVRLGHEITGVVRQGTGSFNIGDRVVVGHHVPCGSCPSCRHENPSMCAQFKSSYLDPCGFAGVIRVPELHVRRTAFKLPDSVSDEEGTFVEPLACALRAVRRSNVLSGDRIAVFGVGVMGLLIGQAVQARGGRAFGVDIDTRRLERAESLGMARLGGEGELDGAVLTAVLPATLQAALAAVRPGGRINLFAGPIREKTFPIDLDDLYHRELALFSSYSASPEDLRDALELIRAGTVRVKDLVTHKLPLEQFEEGLRLQSSGLALKVVFHP